MKNIRVLFYGQDDGARTFEAIFRTESVMNNFMELFEHYGRFTRYAYDVVEDDYIDNNIPKLTCKFRDFKRVYDELYPDCPLQSYNPLPIL